ncbi:MAG: hypothetical protein Q4F88_06825 [Eubacteriales bacterium]|nr:hypothetical protein [Eubacteriales bacterium]
MTRLEVNIKSIEDYVESIRPDNRNHIYLDKVALITLIDDIKKTLPEDLQSIPKLKQEAEDIRNASREEANKFLIEARAKRDQMIDSSNQVEIAKERAEQIVHDANIQADNLMKESRKEILKLYEEALNFYVSSMRDCETQLENMIGSFSPMYTSFYSKVEESYKKLDQTRQKQESNLSNIKAQLQMMEQMNTQSNVFNKNTK